MQPRHTQITRTQEIELPSNRFFIHPISRFLVDYFARWGIHPNLVSVLGMIFGAGAAAAYYQWTDPWMALLGFVLMIGWHVMDGADGQLARLTGKTSDIGKVLDGLCDHGTFILVYSALAASITPIYGAWAWVLGFAAGFSHVAQASAYEFQRQAYDYWVHGKESARIVSLEEQQAIIQQKSGLARFFGTLMLSYLRVQQRFAAIDPVLHARLEEHRAEGKDDGAWREAYRAVNLSAVHRWNVLSSNFRTAAILVACLAGNPLYFFAYEFALLNVALLALNQMQRRRNARLREELAAHGAMVV